MQQICELPPTTIIPCESHVLVSIGDFTLGKANRVLLAAIVQKKGAALEEATPVQIHTILVTSLSVAWSGGTFTAYSDNVLGFLVRGPAHYGVGVSFPLKTGSVH